MHNNGFTLHTEVNLDMVLTCHFVVGKLPGPNSNGKSRHQDHKIQVGELGEGRERGICV
jgi:hypothetical protein